MTVMTLEHLTRMALAQIFAEPNIRSIYNFISENIKFFKTTKSTSLRSQRKYRELS
jgi:hypothetical protein